MYFITNAFLHQGRGWPAVERTYAELVQRRLGFNGLEYQHVELPLVFIEPGSSELQRSAWLPLASKWVCHCQRRRERETRVAWAVREIEDFVRREETWAEDIRRRLRSDPRAREFFLPRRLLRRIRASDPAVLADDIGA